CCARWKRSIRKTRASTAQDRNHGWTRQKSFLTSNSRFNAYTRLAGALLIVELGNAPAGRLSYEYENSKQGNSARIHHRAFYEIHRGFYRTAEVARSRPAHRYPHHAPLTA